MKKRITFDGRRYSVSYWHNPQSLNPESAGWYWLADFANLPEARRCYPDAELIEVVE